MWVPGGGGEGGNCCALSRSTSASAVLRSCRNTRFEKSDAPDTHTHRFGGPRFAGEVDAPGGSIRIASQDIAAWPLMQVVQGLHHGGSPKEVFLYRPEGNLLGYVATLRRCPCRIHAGSLPTRLEPTGLDATLILPPARPAAQVLRHNI